MVVIKAKYFNHVARDWRYLEKDGKDALFTSYPEAHTAVMQSQLRAYNEDEFELEAYVTCSCQTLVPVLAEGSVCERCGATYNGFGERIWTSHREDCHERRREIATLADARSQ